MSNERERLLHFHGYALGVLVRARDRPRPPGQREDDESMLAEGMVLRPYLFALLDIAERYPLVVEALMGALGEENRQVALAKLKEPTLPPEPPA